MIGSIDMDRKGWMEDNKEELGSQKYGRDICYQMMEGMGCLQLNDLELVCLGTKVRPNISLGACPASLRPASFATIAALSLM